MVVVLVLLTIVLFILVGMLTRKEELTFRKNDAEGRSPIFLSPEKALYPVTNPEKRFFHPSHSWVLKIEDDKAVIGFDDFITYLFQTELNLLDLPPIGSKIFQGGKIWNLKIGNKKISQLAPVTGEVIDINPALNMDIKLPSADVEKSWILKIRPDQFTKEIKNLFTDTQATLMNESLREKFVAMASQGHYLNDGGTVDTSCLQKMNDTEWDEFIENFFPYEK